MGACFGLPFRGSSCGCMRIEAGIRGRREQKGTGNRGQGTGDRGQPAGSRGCSLFSHRPPRFVIQRAGNAVAADCIESPQARRILPGHERWIERGSVTQAGGGALTRLARARHPLPQTAWERGSTARAPSSAIRAARDLPPISPDLVSQPEHQARRSAFALHRGWRHGHRPARFGGVRSALKGCVQPASAGFRGPSGGLQPPGWTGNAPFRVAPTGRHPTRMCRRSIPGAAYG